MKYISILSRFPCYRAVKETSKYSQPLGAIVKLRAEDGFGWETTNCCLETYLWFPTLRLRQLITACTSISTGSSDLGHSVLHSHKHVYVHTHTHTIHYYLKYKFYLQVSFTFRFHLCMCVHNHAVAMRKSAYWFSFHYVGSRNQTQRLLGLAAPWPLKNVTGPQHFEMVLNRSICPCHYIGKV